MKKDYSPPYVKQLSRALFQHWIIILLGFPIFPLTYIDLIKADKDAIEKFGDDYKACMKKVPEANFLLGITHRSEKSED